MKPPIALTFALALLCSICSVQAQYRQINYHPDSIRVEFPEQKALVIFEVKQFQTNNLFVKNFQVRLKDLLAYVQKALPSNIGELEPKRIVIKIESENEKSGDDLYRPESEKIEITINDVIPQTSMLVRKNIIEQLLPPGWELFIQTKDTNVTIYAETFEGLEALTQQDFYAVVSALQSDSQMKYAGRKKIESRMIIKNGKIDQQVINYIHPGDLIFITGHTGIGFYRDKFFSEISVSLGLSFKDHFNRRNHRIELICNNMIFPTINLEKNSYGLDMNYFLSFAYSKNLSNTDRGQWVTLGTGLLMLNAQTDYFQGKTIKFFIGTNIGNTKFNLVPEFYLTDNFKKFAFGCKLNYTF